MRNVYFTEINYHYIDSNLSIFFVSCAGDYAANSEMEECVICLERQPEVILPCAHAYCLPCIQQWWEYSAETPGDLLCNIQSFMAGSVGYPQHIRASIIILYTYK